MAAVVRQLVWLLLGVSCAVAQGAPATLREVKVTQTSKGVQVDVSLSESVQPSLQTATHPDRLILDFPNTTAEAEQRRIPVNFNGIRAVRYSLNSAQPPINRVVVDLDNVHLYSVSRNGTSVSLKVVEITEADRTHRVPAAAATGGFSDIFRRHGQSSPQVSNADEELKRPIPGGTSIPKPIPNATASAKTTPTAAHPNLGSLQQGTVFPGLGTPGTGNVPGGAGLATQPPVNQPAAQAKTPSVTVTPSAEAISSVASPPASSQSTQIDPSKEVLTKADSPAPAGSVQTSRRAAAPRQGQHIVGDHTFGKGFFDPGCRLISVLEVVGKRRTGQLFADADQATAGVKET